VLSTGHDAAAIASWAALAAVCIAAVWLARLRREAYWLLGGLILLIPTSSVVPLADLMAERRMYLPLLSISLLIGLLLARIPRWAPAGLAALLAVLTFQRTEVWRNEESLWRDTVEKSPAKVRPKLQLARALGANSPPGREEQLRLLEEALKFAPYDPIVAEQRGAFFLESGIPDAALEEFDRAARLTPGSAQIAANRGVALYMLGRTNEAANSFQHAIQLDPCNFDGLTNLLLLARQRVVTNNGGEMLHRWKDCGFTPEQRRQLRAISP
jgi:tetratricopeptide (TPR) repeat protein